MIILRHVLVVFLIVVTPLWDWYEITRLKAGPAPRKKISLLSENCGGIDPCGDGFASAGDAAQRV